jgi:hypothetical protein
MRARLRLWKISESALTIGKRLGVCSLIQETEKGLGRGDHVSLLPEQFGR